MTYVIRIYYVAIEGSYTEENCSQVNVLIKNNIIKSVKLNIDIFKNIHLQKRSLKPTRN